MKTEKVEKTVMNLHNKKQYVIHIKTLKQILNHKSVLKKVRIVIKFNQKASLKSCIDMNTELRKNEKS